MYELKCINELHSIILVRHKANQIRIARDSGFRVPPTLLSSDREEIINFCNRYKNIIVKPISTNFVPPPIDGRANFVTIMTNSVTLQEILQTDEEAFAAAPAIYQKRIEKAYEIRLVAFGEEAVAYKIDSQRSEAGALDWRRAQYEDIYEWTEATPEMRRLSARFLRHAGLHYGVFDLVVDCNNKLWFLECNADGQWAWLEPQGDGPIARMFARQIQKLLGNP